ncbi:uncharacterized protein SPPG_09326 [Spizellomyces punctatus DAOM BR117]|uniref:Protein ZIP4 homolog n=1 Tax=Spizellomyces punctatus (strain DAOM BR117) TaxID=645134 RepID=A0A0L0HBH8_SPIPD|nr:uncharacterized protein SPPG_09326 [Spizellomyces punctatus DAOM BR117]KNC98950.1 hypothetical protein SPPG_09326 [Spizellomyces punctatus DAOM BR117]|eukprot:XP_016606990.1 hypothetical protein SPPG_09326 [Spizellomyces punctatus DAOM BR117]
MLMHNVTNTEAKAYLGTGELEEVAQICLNCARRATKSADAVQWCRTGIDLLDESKNQTSANGCALKTEILLFLAASYMDMNALEAAEQSADLILQASPSTLLGYHLKIKCLTLKNPPQQLAMDKVYKLAVEHCASTVKDPEQFKLFLGMLHIMARHTSPTVAAAAVDVLLHRLEESAVSLEDRQVERLRILKMYLLMTATNVDDEVTAQVENLIDKVVDTDTNVPLAKTYRLILWQAADRAAQEGHWADAIKWFKCSTRLLLDDPMDSRNTALVHRKLSICYLELGQHSQAYDCCLQAAAKENSPTNDFLSYIILLEQSNQERALDHLKSIPCGKDTFQYFVSAAQAAFKKGNKQVIQEVLKHIVLSPMDWTANDNGANLLTVLRCLIRLTKAQVRSGDEAAIFADLVIFIKKGWEPKISAICRPVYTSKYCCPQAYCLLEGWKASSSLSAEAYAAEVDWLCRVAWNCALSSAVANQIELACELYHLTADILSLSEEETVQVLQSRKICLFATAAGNVSLARQSSVQSVEHLRKAMTALKTMREICKRIQGNAVTVPKLDDPVLHQSIYLEFEINVRMEAWSELEPVLEYANSVGAPVQIFERLAGRQPKLVPALSSCERLPVTLYIDIVTRQKCPSAVIFLTIQAALNAILKHDPGFDVKRFSQWFRVLVRTSLVSNKTAAMGLYDQVLAILKSSSQENPYPKEEVEWLMVAAWNIGCEHWSLNEQANAKKWCEMAMTLADYVETSPLTKEMRESYSDFLASD